MWCTHKGQEVQQLVYTLLICKLVFRNLYFWFHLYFITVSSIFKTLERLQGWSQKRVKIFYLYNVKIVGAGDLKIFTRKDSNS